MENTVSKESRYTSSRREHWDNVSDTYPRSWLSGFYRVLLQKVYKHVVPPDSRILEIGCGSGDLLASLNPGYGVGIDFSDKMLAIARSRHHDMNFILSDAHSIQSDEKFDYIILSDILNDVWDVQSVLEELVKLSAPHTRVIINSYNCLWETPLNFARKIGLVTPNLKQNWLDVSDIRNLLDLAGFETIKHFQEILIPLKVPFVTSFANRFLARITPFKFLAFTSFLIARPQSKIPEVNHDCSVSVIVAARNEAGHIERIVEKIPPLGTMTEIIFVEGHSTDNTLDEIQRVVDAPANHGKNISWFVQEGEGKGDAVRLGFEKASGDILMIYDADMTVPAEQLTRFYNALVFNRGEFINGVRLIYPMEEQAMRFFNVIGNKFFSMVFTWLLDQPVKDTLCGTKVLRKKDYALLAKNRSYFGDFDPFGDFDLLFGAAKLNLKIVDLPIRYESREYGETNISRWKHGLLLLRMVAFAARRIKFV